MIFTVERDRFRLERWEQQGSHYERTGRWPIALGRAGTATPRGVYLVDGRSRTPDWKAPNSEWVPFEDRGVIFEFENPRNPFEGGFISLSGGEGIGIHGTKFDPEVGTRASHGCIRMRTPDLLKIYEDCEVGTVVVIL
jgi:L,D-transpeptidase ErfK/SrfK